jgi:hypothetical protein
MTIRVTTRFRFIPPKVNALLLALLFLVMPLLFITVLSRIGDDGTVSVNGVVVTGEERDQALAEMNKSMAMGMLPFTLIGLWSLRRLLPRSPLDYLEVGPEGLAVRGIFGLSRFTWDEIADVTVRILPASKIPFAWMTVRLTTGRVRRFYLSGYVRIKLFSDLGEQAGEIPDWFSRLKSAYTKGNATGALPTEPWGLIGKMIELDASAPGVRPPNAPVIKGRDA